MSGPKVSVYTLTPEAKANLSGQRRCDRQSLACAKRTALILDDLHTLLASAEQLSVNLQLSGAPDGEASMQKTKAWKQQAAAYHVRLAALTPEPAGELTVSETVLAQKQMQLAQLREMQSAVQQLRQACAAQAAALEQNDQAARGAIRSQIAANVSALEDADRNVQDTECADLKAALTAELSGYLADRRLTESLHAEIRGLRESLSHISDLQHLQSFASISAARIRNAVKACLQLREAYEEAVLRYEVLCDLTGETARPYPMTEDGLKQLEADIQRTEAALVQQQTQCYISVCVDEVMAEMGYDLIGTRDVTKKSGRHFQNRLFTFREGSAVNVTFSSDGQIALELGGLAHEDRIPSDAEAAELTQEMEAFCGEFAEFERRLREKGVIAGSRISLLPPSPAYAAVINLSDYALRSGVQVTDMQTKQRTETRRNQHFISED